MDTGNISSGAGTFDSFKNNNTDSGSKDFLESNSLVAKIAFLLLVLVVFVIAIKFCSQFLSWVFSYNNSPYLFERPSYTQVAKIPGSPDGDMVLVFPELNADLIIKYLKITIGFPFTIT